MGLPLPQVSIFSAPKGRPRGIFLGPSATRERTGGTENGNWSPRDADWLLFQRSRDCVNTAPDRARSELMSLRRLRLPVRQLHTMPTRSLRTRATCLTTRPNLPRTTNCTGLGPQRLQLDNVRWVIAQQIYLARVVLRITPQHANLLSLISLAISRARGTRGLNVKH